MYEKLETCPSCKHPQFDNFLICEDYSVSKESFALVKCKKCELVFTNPRPSKNELGKYYESNEYISHTNKGNSLINILYKLVRSYTLISKRKILQQFHDSGTVLDYGCGTGDFLRVLEKKGLETFGIEPNEQAKKLAEKQVKGKVLGSVEEVPGDQKFDVITAWHVVEHISELRETLKLLRKRLNKDGHFIVAVPNINSHDATIYKEKWAGYDVPRHLYHFSQASFKNLAEKSKFKLVKTLPMKFDSFYVSLLSEKYKNGKSNLIKGLLNGLASNRKAATTGEYSSLIYILKKN